MTLILDQAGLLIIFKQMDPETKPTRLTKDLLVNLVYGSHKESNPRAHGALQVIGMKEDRSQVELSDGFSNFNCLVFKSVRPRLQEADIKNNDVIWAGVLLHKENVYVLFDFKILYNDIDDTIGRPISFEEYNRKGNQNLSGNDQIPVKTNRGAGMKSSSAPTNDDDEEYTPLSLLTAGSNSWALKARVSHKSEIRKYGGGNTGKKEGSLFSVTIFDKSSRVNATFFTEAAQKYYDYLQVGKVYVFSNGEVKRKGTFSTTNSSVELSFGTRSEIVQSPSEGSIPKEYFEFTKLSQVQTMENNSYCDVVGIVLEIFPEEQIMSKKSGEPYPKQVLKIGDDSGVEVEITFWGNAIQVLKQLNKGELVMLTQLRVSEFKGKNLNASGDTLVTTKMPDQERVKEVIVWRNQKEKSGGISSLAFTSMKTTNEHKEAIVYTISAYKKIADEVASMHFEENKRPNFLIKGWLTLLPTGYGDGTKGYGNAPFYYNKCPNETCFKKAEVDESDKNRSLCPNCGPVSKPVIPRFLGTIRIHDNTESIYVKFSNDYVGLTLYGKPSTELKDMEQINHDDLVEYCRNRQDQFYYLRVWPKTDSYNGEIRVNHTCSYAYQLTPKSYTSSCKNLIKTLQYLQTKAETD